MRYNRQMLIGLTAAVLGSAWFAHAQQPQQPPQPMSFFVTSVGLGNGANLGALAGADALMVLTPWPLYREVAIPDIVSAMHGKVIIDPFAVLDGKQVVRAGVEYHTLGKGVSRPGRQGA